MKQLIITGASSGIGQAIAACFLADGWRVLNLSRRPCPEAGVENLTVDLESAASLDALATVLPAQLATEGRICLVHNAAIMRTDRIDALPDAQFRAVLELNLLSPNRLNQLIVPHLGAGSSVLYIGSTLSEKAVPGAASYVIVKHALVGMMRATCQDLAGRGIHTCLIAPGFTDTPQVQALVDGHPERLAAITGLNAFGRLIDPAEIAAAVAYAAESPLLNGAVIHANLGQRER